MQQGKRIRPVLFSLFRHCFGTLEMSERAGDDDPWSLVHVPNQFETKVMCDDPVSGD